MSSPGARRNDDIVIDVIDNGIGLPKVEPGAVCSNPMLRRGEKGPTGLGLCDRSAAFWKTTAAGSSSMMLADIRPGARGGAWMRAAVCPYRAHAPKIEVNEPVFPTQHDQAKEHLYPPHRPGRRETD